MGVNVLIIDDSLATRQVIERTIRLTDPDAGECFHASDGREALDVLAKNWVDLIFCDLHMPRMTGREFIAAVRAHELWKSIPIAVLTSERGADTEEELDQLGANFYRKKPVAPEALRDVFEALKARMP